MSPYMAHIQPKYRSDRKADRAQTMVWLGLGLSGLSFAAGMLFFAYSSLANLFSSGATVSIAGPLVISAAIFASGTALSLIGFALGVGADRPRASDSETDGTIAA